MSELKRKINRVLAILCFVWCVYDVGGLDTNLWKVGFYSLLMLNCFYIFFKTFVIVKVCDLNGEEICEL